MRSLSLSHRFISGFLSKDLQYKVFKHPYSNTSSSQKVSNSFSHTMDTTAKQQSRDSSNNVSYASALQRGKPSTDDASNNNPPSDDITNGNSVISDDIKPNVSSSLNDSFEDAEDSQLTYNSQASKDLSSDCNVNSEGNFEESSASVTTENSGANKSSENVEVNNDPSMEGSGDESDVEDEQSEIDNLYPTALKWRFRPTNPALSLPSTVTVLETNFGSKVYLVGTAHFSVESQEDVTKTIRAVQPDTVMLELCKDRINTLALDEATILEEAKELNFQKMKTTIEQNGLLQGILYFLLLSMSVHFTKELGMAPGGEFRRAYLEAQQIPGCVVHLGDRPIHISLRRALAKLSLWQKIRVAWQILRLKGPISKEEVERCKDKDLLEKMLEEMTGEFPELSQVFVRERDIYLTYSLQMSALPVISPRNPEVPVPSTVVGVVGIGHVAGIKEHWGKVKEEDIPPLLHIPEPSMASKVFRQTIRLSALGMGAYAVYKFFPRSIITSIKPLLTFNGKV
ncbi:hypothetical protein JTE90_010904 [Oedothorax gibbosus]|uniref:TraB domain-containing protein n=1 Tax=Oedothorax gibbosus TaxID=931172 RepID=A0AAV6UG49_9ARAC|nr:hypothetical protein JTE90_010904 [Oedothorax gibbosus]